MKISLQVLWPALHYSECCTASLKIVKIQSRAGHTKLTFWFIDRVSISNFVHRFCEARLIKLFQSRLISSEGLVTPFFGRVSYRNISYSLFFAETADLFRLLCEDFPLRLKCERNIVCHRMLSRLKEALLISG